MPLTSQGRMGSTATRAPGRHSEPAGASTTSATTSWPSTAGKEA